MCLVDHNKLLRLSIILINKYQRCRKETSKVQYYNHAQYHQGSFKFKFWDNRVKIADRGGRTSVVS